MENKPNYLYSSNNRNHVQNISSEYLKKYFRNMLFGVLNPEIKISSIYFLSVLFMMSGFLLFIYGLFLEHLYQFVMGFVFLISGFILDSTVNRRQEEN